MPDDVIARLEEAGLLDQTLVAELLAVVGGDDHDRVVPLTEAAQRAPQATQLGVDLAAHAEVLGLDVGEGGRVGRRGGELVGQQGPVEPVRVRSDREGRRHVGGVVRLRPVTGCGVGRMGAEVGGVGEPRFAPVFDPTQELVGQERRLRELGRAVGLGLEGGVGVGEDVPGLGQSLQPRPSVTGEVEADVEAGKDALVVRQARIVGIGDGAGIHPLVGVAEQRRGVAGAVGRPGRCCRSDDRVESRCRGPGSSSGRSRCRAPPDPAHRARPGRGGWPGEPLRRRARRGSGFARSGGRRTTANRLGTDRA